VLIGKVIRRTYVAVVVITVGRPVAVVVVVVAAAGALERVSFMRGHIELREHT
jgi:hypothetical protein